MGARRVANCVASEEPHREPNGWQMKIDNCSDRLSSLFNCWTMSDVVFRIQCSGTTRELPAHRFVLGAASPVFHMQFFEMATYTSMDLPAGIEIDDVPFNTFFEFVRFIYTDDVTITLSNVTVLMSLADRYKVMGLCDFCFSFLRRELQASCVLRILNIVQIMMTKAVFGLWKDVVEQQKILHDFRAMSLAERQRRLRAVSRSVVSSRRSSLASRSSGESPSATSCASFRSGPSVIGGCGGSVWEHSLGCGLTNEPDPYKLMRDEEGVAYSFLKKSQQHCVQLAQVAEELKVKCWRCLRENTETVVQGADWPHQTRNFVQAVLSLNVCHLAEISIFHAMNRWASFKCQELGLAPLPEHRKTVLGRDTIALIRFPTMTLEEFQWQVVPTGLLEPEDVRHVQHAITKRLSDFGRFGPFSGDERAKPTVKKDRFLLNIDDSSVVDTPKHTYLPVDGDGDIIDAMLGAELLRNHVDSTVAEDNAWTDAYDQGLSYSEDRSTGAVLWRCQNPQNTRRGNDDMLLMTPSSPMLLAHESDRAATRGISSRVPLARGVALLELPTSQSVKNSPVSHDMSKNLSVGRWTAVLESGRGSRTWRLPPRVIRSVPFPQGVTCTDEAPRRHHSGL